MANAPIQIVLNPENFIHVWDRTGGGPNKDFYEGNDASFIAHQQSLQQQLLLVRQRQIENAFSEVTYAKVVLKPSALAKTHRPTHGVFAGAVAPVVGGGDLGELFVEFSPQSIDHVSEKIASAEVETRYRENAEGKKVAYPSALRSEVGAIDHIEPYTEADKRRFSIEEGLQWISNPRTGGAYIVELFEAVPPRQTWDQLPREKFKLFKSFQDGLMAFGQGIVVSRIVDSDRNSPMIGVRLENSSHAPVIQFMPSQSSVRRQAETREIVRDVAKHGGLISFLDAHPLVKRIVLPPVITQSVQAGRPGEMFNVPARDANRTYPKVAIVDGGVAAVLDGWVIDKWNLLAPGDGDEDHGTFIGGLLICGKELNAQVCQELDGCEIIDLDLLPNEGSFLNYYNKGPLQFFKELEVAVLEIKARTGVRIFNFSLNIEEHASSGGYSPAAKLLDSIAEDNDVIFVISAGNTKPQDCRREWPNDPVQALGILASSRNDIIKTPAESCRNLSVAAVNPPNLGGIVPYAPSAYTCRGPGLRVGLKPDLAHVGGSGTRHATDGHGLTSLLPSGQLVDGCGTSYAAPNVAKILACIEHEIEGEISRETLMGLAVHNAGLPSILADKKFSNVAKHLVGFGIPKTSEEVLQNDDSSITLVFASRIYQGRKMSFNFSWPRSLVRDGKCFGKARLTVVSTPPFDYSYGAEFVRVNIDGHLRQEQNDGKYLGRLSSIYLPEHHGNQLLEKNQIEHALKWSPIKVAEKTFPRGVGPSTNWRLDIEYLARDGQTVPVTGVPFTAILTISDPDGEQPVFNDMRQHLRSLGIDIMDIKAAAKVMPRV